MWKKIRTERAKAAKIRYLSLSMILFVFCNVFLYNFQINLIKFDFKVTFKRFHTWRRQIHDIENVGTLFIGLVSHPGSKNQNETYHTWMKKLNTVTDHEAVFISEEESKVPGAKTIKPYDYKFTVKYENYRTDYDRSLKRVSGARYFIEKTNHKWYWAACDDIVVDVEAIDKMIYDLEKTYDPLKDRVFKGHCIFHFQKQYLQGGIGYLFSRKAAEDFVNGYGEEFIAMTSTYDDVHSADIKKYLNISTNKMSLGNFFGTWFARPFTTPDFYKDYIVGRDDCDKVIKSARSKTVGVKAYPLKNLVGLHLQMINSPIPIKQAMEYIIKAKAVENSLYYYFDGLLAKFCRGEKYPIDDYFDNDDVFA